jgi:broad specificity phosphatase PhoE
MLRVPAFHTLPDPCDFYFVRHGESESNAGQRIQGHTESPLSAVGKSHADSAGRWFTDKGIDVVLTSPLSRARETAEAIAHRTGAPTPALVDELIELDTGLYSGERIADLPSIDEELYRRFRMHSWEVVPEAERIESLQRRAHAVWGRLIELARAGHRRFVSVTHGGTIQWLIKATIGSDDQRWMPLFETSNCGIFLFRAESTLAGAGEPEPGTGYYGAWKLVNHVPYR